MMLLNKWAISIFSRYRYLLPWLTWGLLYWTNILIDLSYVCVSGETDLSISIGRD